MIKIEDVAKCIDHTILKPESSFEDVKKLCDEAKNYDFAAVCILPYFVNYAKNLMVRQDKVCTVVGFPHGSSFLFTKIDECMHALKHGAGEIDMVMNIPAFLSKDYRTVETEIVSLVDLTHTYFGKVKVIIETCLLTEQQKIDACTIVSSAGADFIKTSTGFSHGGATIHDVELLRKYCADEVKVKASGGIKTAAFALDLMKAGAERIGTSSGVTIINELMKKK